MLASSNDKYTEIRGHQQQNLLQRRKKKKGKKNIPHILYSCLYVIMHLWIQNTFPVMPSNTRLMPCNPTKEMLWNLHKSSALDHLSGKILSSRKWIPPLETPILVEFNPYRPWTKPKLYALLLHARTVRPILHEQHLKRRRRTGYFWPLR